MPERKKVNRQLGDIPTIRSIIRQGNLFICGLCRSNHDVQGRAVACLNRCWLKVNRLEPAVPVYTRPKFQGMKPKLEGHKCRYCSRIYNHMDEAVACAMDCRTTKKHGHKIDLQVFEMKAEDLEVEPFEFATFSSAPVNKEVHSRFNLRRRTKSEIEEKKAAEEAEKQKNEEANSQQDSTASKDSKKDSQAPEKPKQRKKSEFKSASIRKDAKYQCVVCKELYFTKIETEGCFNNHFDEDGLEILD